MRKLLTALLYFVFGVIVSIIVGFSVYGQDILSTTNNCFHFISLGMTGAIILALVRLYRAWVAAIFILVLLILMVGPLLILKLPLAAILFYMLWYMGAGYTIFGMGCLFKAKIQRLPIGKFLLLGIALAILYIVKTFLIHIPITKPIPVTEIISNAILGLLVGGSLGLGTEIGELLDRLVCKEIGTNP
ncbi:MAG: hypothetical protein AB1756_07745 [Acidobacteriota bacterium]